MPAALELDWEAIRMLAMEIGIKPAAERLGLMANLDALYQRSKREGWIVGIPRCKPFPPTVSRPVSTVISPSQALLAELRELGSKTRLGHAKAAAGVATHVAEREPAINIADAQNVKAAAQTAGLVFGWQAAGPGSRTGVDVLMRSGNTEVAVRVHGTERAEGLVEPEEGEDPL